MDLLGYYRTSPFLRGFVTRLDYTADLHAPSRVKVIEMVARFRALIVCS